MVLTIADSHDISKGFWPKLTNSFPDMPYSGFEADFINQKNGANDYVRKHKYETAHGDVALLVDRN